MSTPTEKYDINQLINQYMPSINKALEHWIPRKWNENDLVGITGMQRYKGHLESLNKSTTEPMWELLDRGIVLL